MLTNTNSFEIVTFRLIFWQTHILTTFAHAQINRRASRVSALGALVSGYYWIGLAQLEDNKQHWIDGSQYTGSAISGRGNKCIKAGIAVGGVQWKADNCNSIYPCICEEVAPPGKGIYHVFGGSFGVWAQSMRGDVILRRLLSLAKPIPRLIPGYQQSLSVSPWLANAPVSSIFPLFLQPSVAPWKTSVNVKDNLYSYFTMILHPH